MAKAMNTDATMNSSICIHWQKAQLERGVVKEREERGRRPRDGGCQ